jgi:hypothetical protein
MAIIKNQHIPLQKTTNNDEGTGGKGNPYTLLVGKQISPDSMEIGVEVLQ